MQMSEAQQMEQLAGRCAAEQPETEQGVSPLLLTEMNHRIANSLQLASSILLTRALRTESAEAREELSEVAKKIHAIGLLHRRLCQSADIDAVDLGGYIQELCADLGASTIGGKGAVFRFKADGSNAAYVDSDTATRLGMIVTELLTNCAKYAGETPTCSVGLSTEAGQIRLTVSDNGPGFSGHSPLRARGVGLQMVQGLVSQLKARIEIVPSVIGAHYVITAPLVAGRAS